MEHGEKQTIPDIRDGETLGLRTLEINQGEQKQLEKLI